MPYTTNGTRWAKLKREFRVHCEATHQPCWICREPINYQADWRHRDAFQPDHHYPVSTHPHLQYEPTNLRPSHRRCNASRGNTIPANTNWTRADW
jgi:hypothetical protein